MTAIAPTQPDQIDPASTGGPYKLSADSGHHINACKDKKGTTVALQTCLDDAAYSAYLGFTMDRVIAHTAAPTAPAN